jgi:hypothetical protein
VRLTISLQVEAKYLGCVVCKFHVAAGAGSVPCQKPVRNNLQKWFLFPTGRLNFGFIIEGILTTMIITPSSWGSQLVRQHRTINDSFQTRTSRDCRSRLDWIRSRIPAALRCAAVESPSLRRSPSGSHTRKRERERERERELAP